MNVLECRGLKKSFGELEVLKDINFEVEKGKVVAILDHRVQANQLF